MRRQNLSAYHQRRRSKKKQKNHNKDQKKQNHRIDDTYWPAEVLLDHPLNHREGHGRRLVQALLELHHERLGEQRGGAGDELPQLHVGGAQVLEEDAQYSCKSLRAQAAASPQLLRELLISRHGNGGLQEGPLSLQSPLEACRQAGLSDLGDDLVVQLPQLRPARQHHPATGVSGQRGGEQRLISRVGGGEEAIASGT
eukprot:scaffold5442_cov223-Pinguiococcus_pyrenoidosus.AAC.1